MRDRQLNPLVLINSLIFPPKHVQEASLIGDWESWPHGLNIEKAREASAGLLLLFFMVIKNMAAGIPELSGSSGIKGLKASIDTMSGKSLSIKCISAKGYSPINSVFSK